MYIYTFTIPIRLYIDPCTFHRDILMICKTLFSVKLKWKHSPTRPEGKVYFTPHCLLSEYIERNHPIERKSCS